MSEQGDKPPDNVTALPEKPKVPIYHVNMDRLGGRVGKAEAEARQAVEDAQAALGEIEDIQAELENLEEVSVWQFRFEALLTAVRDPDADVREVANEIVREIPEGGLRMGLQWPQ